MPRTILHVDLDAFFCAVEEQRDPPLRGKAFAVGGNVEGRGVVSSCSYPARRFGVCSAMPMVRALALCPDLLRLPTSFPAYRAASHAVMQRLRARTPMVEQISIDEAFLDVSELSTSGGMLAQQLQAQIREELGLPCSIGVATNKLVAKVATDVGKASARSDGPPNAICTVPPGVEAAFLAHLPAIALWGVGTKTAERLAALGLHTIGDIAAWPSASLERRFGQHGRALARHARGLDDRPVIIEHAAKSVSRETTFPRDVEDVETLQRTDHAQAADVGKRLRRAEMVGTTVKLRLRWSDFTTLTRQATLPRPTAHDAEIATAALHLLDQVWPTGDSVRLIGVGVTGLCSPSRQLSLWESERSANTERDRHLQITVASLRDRYGYNLFRWGSDVPSR
ncbi:MAG: DNA polymerase IV [Chloroflexia bacterium]|nr:DNA polymerase IV [Chloroflexia bacterium]